jgi:AraC family transcriptional regulator
MENPDKRILISRAGLLEPRVAQTPLVSSAGNNWQGIQLERHTLKGPAESKGVIDGFQICCNLTGPVDAEWLVNGRWEGATLNGGDLCLAPHGEFRSVAWSESYDLLLVSIAPELMSEISAGPVELKPQRAFRDPNIETICKLLLADTAAGTPAGPAYGEHLGSSLSAYLAKRFGIVDWQAHCPGTALPGPVLRRVCELIEARLSTPIGLQDLAHEARMSRFHFSRLFRRSTGESPYRYLQKRRIERAKEMLATGCSATEVANATGFSSPNHLSSLFRRFTGMTPRQFRALCEK